VSKIRPVALSVALLIVASLRASPLRAEEPASAPPAAVVSSPSPAPSTSLRKLPALVTGGLAVVTLATGAVFGVLAWQDHEDFQTHPLADTANRGESRGLTADMCFGAAATLGVAALVMYFTHDDAGAPSPQTGGGASRVAVAPFVSAHGGGAGAVVRF
jgi:hypothetical protein